MTADVYEPCLITLFCDSVTTSVIREACCIQTVALHSFKSFQEHPELKEPMGIFINASAIAPELLKEILTHSKEKWNQTVRIGLVDQNADEELDQCFMNGAHDVIRKPLRSKEILTRLQSRMRDLTEVRKTQNLQVGDMSINVVSKQVIRGGNRVQLSNTTFNVLMALVETPSTTVSRQTIRTRVWGDVNVVDGAIDRQIHELRKTLKTIGTGNSIDSIYAAGFQLVLRPEKANSVAQEIKISHEKSDA